MKRSKKYERDVQKMNLCSHGSLASTLIGESDYVKNNRTLKGINTLVGIGLSGCSLVYAIKSIDRFEDGDEVKFIRFFLRRFVASPIINGIILAYSQSSEEKRREIRQKLGLKW